MKSYLQGYSDQASIKYIEDTIGGYKIMRLKRDGEHDGIYEELEAEIL